MKGGLRIETGMKRYQQARKARRIRGRSKVTIAENKVGCRSVTMRAKHESNRGLTVQAAEGVAKVFAGQSVEMKIPHGYRGMKGTCKLNCLTQLRRRWRAKAT